MNADIPKKAAAFVLLLVGLSLLLSFISSLDFSRTGLSGFIGGGFHKDSDKPPEVSVKPVPVTLTEANLHNLSAESDPPHTPLFFVEGLNSYTNHLRLFTSSEYRNGEWIKDKVEYDDKPVSKSGHITKYRVTPIVPFSEHIPVAKDTFYVTAPASFNAETGTYFISDNLSTPYEAFSASWRIEADKAASDGGAKLDLKEEELKRIKKLAEEITKNAKTDYEKAKAIEKFLEENYEYDPNFNFPSGEDPIYHFLFYEKKGVCKHFASAFIAMCESVGLPARAVFGYLAKPVEYNQTVFASQAHMWAEVKFEEGWIEFDPTPPPKRIKTVTEITYVDKVAKKGGNFTVKGYVKSEYGYVPSGYVEIYVKKNKNEEGILLDLLPVKNGWFEGNVSVPDIAGEYHVMAHYVGSLKYGSSWSDPIIKIYSPPELEVNIPDKVSLGVHSFDGRLYDYNGTPMKNAIIFVNVDGKAEKVKTDENGFFEFTVEFSEERFYDIRLTYSGSKYILPISVEKSVEAGRVELTIHNTKAIRGQEWNSTGELYFRGEPLGHVTIDFENLAEVVTDSKGRFEVKTKIPENSPLGSVRINYTIQEMDCEGSIFLNIRAPTQLDVVVKKDSKWVVLVYLKDENGDPAYGEIRIGNTTAETQNGVAKFEFDELPEKFVVVFPGNEMYLPSKKEVNRSSIPYWILFALLPLAAYAIASKWKKTSGYIVFEWDGEEEDLPPVWGVNEEVRIVVKNLGDGILRAFLDGESIGFHEKGLKIELVFPETGKHLLTAERLVDGKVKERAELKINIVDYRDAVIELFSELVKEIEKKKNVDLKDATAREVLKTINALNSEKGQLLLRLFEIAKYGYGDISRKEFIEAFRTYSEIRREINE